MKKLRWQIIVVVLALVAIGVLLVSQKSTILPEIVAQVQPSTGGVYSEAIVGSLGRLNPLLDLYNPADRDVDRLLFSGLVSFDSRGIPRADLAESWGVSADGTVYNFSIRPNAVWHDGEPVTAEDVLFTVELMRSEGTPIPDDLRQFWNDVEILILDERTLQFRIPEPFAPFMDYAAFGVLPKHLLANLNAEQLISDSFNIKPIGSGPYRFDHLIVEEGEIKGVVLKAFKDYYLQPPFIEEVGFHYVADAAAGLAAYRAGDVMGIGQVTTDILPEALKDEGLNLYTGRLPRLTLVYLNLGKTNLPFFQSAALRRALMMGINRQRIIDRLLNGQAVVADGPILPESWAYYDGIEHVPYDPQKADALIKKDGYTVPAEGTNIRAKEGISFSFEMVYPAGETYAKIAESIRADWIKLGVEVRLKEVPYETLISDYLETRNYDAALVDLNLARSPDPDPYPFWHQSMASGGQNYARWDDRLASEYLEQARVQTDLDERARRYRNFQVRFTTEMPALPLFFPVYSYAVDGEVQGVSMGPLFDLSDRFSTITSWFLVTGQAE